MDNTDFIVTSRLKNQLLNVYSHFHYDRCKKGQTATTMFLNLDSAKTVKQFREWCDNVNKYDFTLDCGAGARQSNNVLGSLAETASCTGDGTLTDFMNWKQGVNYSSWHKIVERDCNVIKRIKKTMEGKYDAHIVLFKNGRQWAAIAGDANRIFEAFGWQTGYVNESFSKLVSWLHVTHGGMEVLKASSYTIKVLDLGKVNIVTNAYLEELVADAQQRADYKRLLIKNNDKTHEKIKCNMRVIAHTPAVQKELDIDTFRFEGNNIIAELGSGSEVLMADGKNWLFNDIGFPLTVALGKSL